MRIAFKNFGCRANNFETDGLYLEAIRRGMMVVSDDEVADAYVINSCTVTANADRDARNQVYRFKRANPSAVVAVIGCYAQVAKEELLALSGVDYVVGTADKIKVLDLIETAADGRDHVLAATGYLPENFVGSRNARANIKIQDGCNYKCTFCTIPMARGRSRSLIPEVVEKQIAEAAAQGFQEVVLTGIHLAHYGWEHNSDLKGLLDRLLAKDGPRIRLSTLDPFEIPDGLLDLMATNSKLCPFLHIALQSGDDEVLKRMRRVYKVIEFESITEQIQKKVPHAYIGVDVIVGFPGETLEAFKRTVVVLEKTHWSKLHVFSFSARKGTEAAKLDGKAPAQEIARRSAVLRELSDRRNREFLLEQIGRTQELLIERPSRKRPGRWLGHTESYVPVEFEGAGVAKQIVPVRLTSAMRSSVAGELIPQFGCYQKPN
ncbi:MAG: tRNA (N(6)-L-threonylcarbamoyladenosine(37)-C(2))-methylthiotransferase MtaB [Deltaproteobacteria bacterium]|nr:tRNA (N(6)-L-threonylcarbamoyladenosine(37)-C(2))-methylthiotransferase MtaB [Deltaproteobacteria bacterium]MBI3293103.1 tRNA (N(6)-L-threonylcarbamoyladenosine(37)-C(2))-methylthiotransferase MtaB [Deltaproteobacteria bacterium]